MINFELRNNELELLGLKSTEKKILKSISKVAKPIAMISRHTGIPRTSLLYMLKKLEGKFFVKRVAFNSRTHWHSNLPQIMSFIKNIQANKKRPR